MDDRTPTPSGASAGHIIHLPFNDAIVGMLFDHKLKTSTSKTDVATLRNRRVHYRSLLMMKFAGTVC
jgi:hypothetical protein